MLVLRRIRGRWLSLAVAIAVSGAACTDNAPSTTAIASAPAGDLATPRPASQAASEFSSEWPKTDFSKTTINLDEVLRGCPVRDCIPALDVPGAVEVAAKQGGHARFAPANTLTYAPQLPVAVVTSNGVTKAFPLHILTWHEVVNDRFGEVPVVVTFCPLCNTAISFDRRVDGKTLDFGVSGNLRNSDLIMWDRQTESWWQQASGEAIVGINAGQKLAPVSTQVVSFGDFLKAHPAADVLTEDTGFGRSYGINPYEGYDSSTRPFLFSGKLDPRLPALDRVVTLDRGGEGIAIALGALASVGVANLDVAGVPIAVFWAPGTVTALGAESIKDAKDIGSAAAYYARVDGRKLRFRPGTTAGTFLDDESGSTWTILGNATDGQLKGRQLEVVFHTTEFWFSWAAFHPKTQIWTPPR